MLEILTYPNQFLSRATEPVKNIDGQLQAAIAGMADTMYRAPGVGLAAIQVGLNQSLLIYDIAPRDEGRDLHVLINPEIVEQDGSVISENEGCLSVPDFRADVKRSEAVLVKGFDGDGNPVEIETDGFLAIVLQHEIDHLSGRLFIDRLSSLKRQLYKRRVQKQLKSQSS